VSRVLNGDPNLRIRESTRARVFAAVAELGFRPNAAARSLRTSRAAAIGFVVPDFANPIYATIVRGAEAAAEETGQSLLIGSAPPEGGGGDRSFDLLRQGRVDGLLIAAELTDADLPADRDNLPWLLVNRTTPSARRWVLLDEQRAMELAVEHLVGLGHRHIGHLGGPVQADTAQRRRVGYEAALVRHGLPSGPIVHGEYTIEGGVGAMRELLSLAEQPTAIVVATIASAAGALIEARAAGVRVPEELSVIAVHDLALAQCFAPSLTTVRMPLEELGRRAVQLVTTAAPGEVVEETVSGTIEVVVRESTGAPPRSRRMR
jgi:LacI family transcriptional regulator